MIQRLLLRASACVCAGALAACGGGGGGSSFSPVPTSAPTTTPAAAVPTAQFTVASAHAGSVSFALQSVNGAANTSVTVIAPISASAPGCASSAATITCTLAVGGVIGTDLYRISSYASSDGSGTPLAVTSLAVNVSATPAAPVAVALDGVPAQVAFSPAHLPLVDDGLIHRVALTVVASDASGAAIVGAAPYRSPISLQILGDPSHALSLSTTSVTQPGTVVTLTYDSSKPLPNAQIVASGDAMPNATLDAAPLSVSPSALQMFDDAAGGGSVQVSESGFSGAFTASLANASDAAVNVVPGTLGSGNAVVTVVPSAGTRFDVTHLTVSDGLASTTVPVSIVPQNGSYQAYGNQHQLNAPLELAKGPDGRIWTGDAPNGNLVAFDPSAHTYTTYTVTNDGNGPSSLAFDASGNIWFTDRSQIGEYVPSSGAVTFYSTGLSSQPNVTTIIAGPASSNTMWFYDMGSNSILRGGQPSYVGKIDTTTGAITEYETSNSARPVLGLMSMAVGPDGAIWFTDGANYAIDKLDPSSGAISEYQVSTPQYPTQSPGAIVAGPDGKMWFLAYSPSTGNSLYGNVDPSNGAVSTYTNGIVGGLYYSLIVGSDHNLWFAEDEALGGFFMQTYTTIGVINPSTNAVYQYGSFIPNYSIITSLLDGGNGTLWMLDGNGYGQIGSVTFK